MPPPERQLLSQSLSAFNASMQFLLDNDEHDLYVKHGLCGHGVNFEGEPYQAVLDPILNRLPLDYALNGLRDYDSLIGISSHIRCHTALTVYPLPRFEDCLTNNIHLRYPCVSRTLGQLF